MIFINSKYTLWYNNIIIKAQNRASPEEYTEKHHIIPKSLGGSDDNNNLVVLTSREHYLCHRLLAKMTLGDSKKKMIYALYCITHVRNKGQSSRYIPNSKIYAQIKEEWRLSIKGREPWNKNIKTGIEPANKGIKGIHKHNRSDEYRKKMSLAKKGKPIPKLQGRVSNRKGVVCSESQKEKTRQSMLGKNAGPRPEWIVAKLKTPKRRICRLSDRKEMSVNVFNRNQT